MYTPNIIINKINSTNIIADDEILLHISFPPFFGIHNILWH